jgi:hypothetical protein
MSNFKRFEQAYKVHFFKHKHMKTKLLMLLGLLVSFVNLQSQTLIFTAPGSKQGLLKISSGKVEANEFVLALQVDWLDKDRKPIDDKRSLIVFDKNKVKMPGDGKIVCKTFEESRSNLFYFNSTLTLKFVVDDDINIDQNKFTVDIPFSFAPTIDAALNPSQWQNFLARSPRNFLAHFTINPSDIKDVTPPQITVLTPDGVMDGFRPQIFTNEVEVKVLVKDRNPLAEVNVNSTKAVPLNDSVFIAKVPLSRIGGTYPIRVTANDLAGNVGEQEFFVEAKVASDVEQRLLAEQLKVEMVSDVDTLIPSIGRVYENRFALIVGNEDYRSHQKGLNYESNVEFARRDAETFKQYAINTLGVKESNIIFMLDAKAVEMHRGINQLTSLLKATQGNGEAIVFFAGHGFPDEKTREGHIIPVDVSGNDLEFAIKLKDLYTKLGENPSKGITVFLDACFSGGGREQGLLAARAVRVRPREEPVKGNVLVLSASAGNESALPYRNKFHGMFSYYLLKALQDSSGDITMGELVDYVTSKVATSSIIHNNKEQNPTLNVSHQLSNDWRSWKLNR